MKISERAVQTEICMGAGLPHTNDYLIHETIERTLPSPAEFVYLDQDAVLMSDVLDMPKAMSVLEEALGLMEVGQVRMPHKVVLRNGDTAESEDAGRFNALFAAIGGPVRATGMKWIGSYPANRDRGLPRASA